MESKHTPSLTQINEKTNAQIRIKSKRSKKKHIIPQSSCKDSKISLSSTESTIKANKKFEDSKNSLLATINERNPRKTKFKENVKEINKEKTECETLKKSNLRKDCKSMVPNKSNGFEIKKQNFINVIKAKETLPIIYPKKSFEKTDYPNSEIIKHQSNFLTKFSGLYVKPIPPATDLETWKKRNNLPLNSKVFIINNGYEDIRNALIRRGWVENKDLESVCFDFKWALKAKDISYSNLLPHQIVNHFGKNSALTTKMGLCHSLRNLISFNNVNIDTFYPKCYNLVESHDISDFIEEYKVIYAESVLKKIIKGIKIPSDQKLISAYEICRRRAMDLDEILDDPCAGMPAVTNEEWEILSDNFCDKESEKDQLWVKRLNKKLVIKPQIKTLYKSHAEYEKKPSKEQIMNVLKNLEKKYPQYNINGVKNIWIVKPAGSSRGRGIQMFDNLKQIMEYANSRELQYVVQKYIENPMIIMNRKFDIRQWVLVTNINPLTVWFYHECYIRFGAVEYHLENFDNKFMHLTNNSVTKYFTGNTNQIEGNMWDQPTFVNYLQQKYGTDIFFTKIQPMMKKIVVWSLESVQDSIIHRKNSMELFGYDFMIDELGNPWLIEVNSSPAMDYSTVFY